MRSRNVPMKKRVVAICSSLFRPSFLSPMRIRDAELNMAPNSDTLAICPISNEFRAPRDVDPSVIDLTTEEDVPMSEPKSAPPSAAVAKEGSHGGKPELLLPSSVTSTFVG